MMFGSFAAAALPWQNFYLLVGTAAATLVGLMFVAVTFGSGLVKPETATTARSFLDPIVNHLVQTLLVACLVIIPTMGSAVFGILLLFVSAFRLVALVGIYRHMRLAHSRSNDIELSDWVMGIAIPIVCHLLLAASGVAFTLHYVIAFDVLAVVTIVNLMNGVYGAWELMVWMALARNSKP